MGKLNLEKWTQHAKDTIGRKRRLVLLKGKWRNEKIKVKSAVLGNGHNSMGEKG